MGEEPEVGRTLESGRSPNVSKDIPLEGLDCNIGGHNRGANGQKVLDRKRVCSLGATRLLQFDLGLTPLDPGVPRGGICICGTLATGRFLLRCHRQAGDLDPDPGIEGGVLDTVRAIAGDEEVLAADQLVSQWISPGVLQGANDSPSIRSQWQTIILLPVLIDETQSLFQNRCLCQHQATLAATVSELHSDVIGRVLDRESRKKQDEALTLSLGVGHVGFCGEFHSLGFCFQILDLSRHFDGYCDRIGHDDVVIDRRREVVTKRNAHQEERHDHRLHLLRRLGISKLQSCDGDHHLGRGEDRVGENLPADGGAFSGIDEPLGDRHHGKASDHHE